MSELETLHKETRVCTRCKLHERRTTFLWQVLVYRRP